LIWTKKFILFFSWRYS